MRKTVKITLGILITVFSLFWITFIFLFIAKDINLLSPDEQQKIKAEKFFWKWPSAHGPLAMHYIEKGSGPHHLLFLHGFRAHSFTWKALIDPLADAGYHVWAIDLIGYGLSDKPEHAVYNADFFTQQIHAFMEAKGIKQVHLIGNSMGGGLALSTALSYPKEVLSLTLISALGYPLEIPFYLSIGKHLGPFFTPFVGPTLIRFCLKQIFYQSDRISDEQVEAYSFPYRFPGGFTASVRTLENFDNQYLIEMEKHYASLTSPTLIIWGDHDHLIPLSHYEKFVKDFPHADNLLITNCGHIPQEETPDLVLSALLEFLQKARS